VLATDHHSESCVLPTQGEHPDLYQIDASSDSVNLATIRDLVSKLKLVPFLGGARVVLIDNGEQLSNLSYQLLLKPIEECTPRTHFVILTSALLRIPVTIRSRSTLMNFGELSSIELVQIIKGQSAHLKDSQLLKDDLQLKELLALGDGTVGTALSMIEGQGEWEQLKQLFRALRQSGFKAVLDLVDFFTKHTKELDSRLALLRVFVRAAVKRSRSVEAKRHWALLLTNVLEAERLLWDRKLPAEQLLLPLFNDFQSSLRDRTDPELISSYDVYSS
jgi:DNA polymerase III delta prime subunit